MSLFLGYPKLDNQITPVRSGLWLVLAVVALFILFTTGAGAESVVVSRSFQQGVNGYTGARDTWIQQWRDDRLDHNFGGLDHLQTYGHALYDGAQHRSNTLIKFANVFGPGGLPPGIRGGDIIRATLTVTVFDALNLANGDLRIRPMLTAWEAGRGRIEPALDGETTAGYRFFREDGHYVAGDHWGNTGQQTNYPVGGVDFGDYLDRRGPWPDMRGEQGTDAWPVQLDVTPAVRAWADGSMENHGFYLSSEGSWWQFYRIYASGWEGRPEWRPKLTIEYQTQLEALLVELNSGTQFVSSNLRPLEKNIEADIFAALIDSGSLNLVRDGAGRSLQPVAGQWLNPIGAWTATEGYLVHMNQADTLRMEGEIIHPQTPIELVEGYQFVAYFPAYSLTADEAFESIREQGLVYVRDSAGRSLRQEDGHWVDAIGELRPGQGYLVRMNAPATLVYPEEEPLVLIEDGLAAAVIAVPAEPRPAENLSAERLRYYLQRMTGVELEIVSENAVPAGKKTVYVGRTAPGAALRQVLEADSAAAESALVTVNGRNAVIAGIDDIGTIHAVYFLLEELGFRWYFPAPWGIVVPDGEIRVELAAGQRRYEPDFKIRTGLPRTTAAYDQDPDWMANEWGRGNHLGGWRWWGAGHSYRYLVSPGYFDSHPEWFAYYDGGRHPTQLCTTNPEVRQKALETVRNVLAAHADVYRLICISPRDNNLFCECENCRELIPRRDDGSLDLGDRIDRIVEFANFIADDIRDDYPDHYVTYYVDYHSVGAPRLVEPAENTVFWITHWRQNQFHGISPDTPMGQSLERWGQYGNPLYIYTYWGSYGSFTFWPVVHSIRQEVPYHRDAGVIGIYSETHQHWGGQHLQFIVFPRLLWNSELDVDAWIDDFCTRFYGPAAAPMRQYYELLENRAESGPAQYHLHSGIIRIFPPDILDQLRQLIDQAELAVAEADEVYRQRLRFVGDGFRAAELYISIHHLRSEYGSTKEEELRQRIVAKYEELIELIERPEYYGLLISDMSTTYPVIYEEYESFVHGTSFAPGGFSYSDYFPYGGSTAVDTIRHTGFINGTWGLDLHPGATGELVYEFKAREGEFKTAELNGFSFGSNLVGIRIQVGTDLDGPWQTVYSHEYPDVDNPAHVPLPLNLTGYVTGRSSFLLRILAMNRAANYVCALTGLAIRGEIEVQ